MNENNHTKVPFSPLEIRFSSEQGFFDKSPIIRFFLSALFVLALVIFLHFRESKIDILDLNSTASRYIVAQVDFDFSDEEATIILKQEAVRDVGKIFKLSEKQISQIRAEFDRELLHNQSMRKQWESLSLDELFKIVDLVQKDLIKLRFTDSKTLQKVRDLPNNNYHYQVYNTLENTQEALLPAPTWAMLQDKLITQEAASKPDLESILKYFRMKKWRIEEDIPTERYLRKIIQSNVPTKFTHVGAGSRIIDQGEKVTSRHLAMLQGMHKALKERRNLSHPLSLLGSAIFASLIAGICFLYLRFSHPHTLYSNRQLCLLITIVILVLALSKGFDSMLYSSQGNFIDLIRYPLFVPLAAILTYNLMNVGLALFVSGLLTFVISITLTLDQSEFMMVNLLPALVSIFIARPLHRRQEVFEICGKAWLSGIAVIFSIHFYEQSIWSLAFIFDLLSTSFFMLLTAILTLGLLPLFEGIFHVMSDVTLMEYMDPNHELLRRLSFEAPGTYQHTLFVCNIAEAAALTIGANGLFCRAASLYHDIGKMTIPQYFTENQPEGINVHQLLTPAESAHAIINHVSEGVALARKANIPEQIIDIIKEHHGTTLVYYFYRQQLDRVGGDKSLVNDKDFRYAGPKPKTKESAIVMIADSFEAASRSLDKIDEHTLSELLNRIVREKTEDGQFDDCMLTFEELTTVKRTMVKVLVAAMHSRIKYPSCT